MLKSIHIERRAGIRSEAVWYFALTYAGGGTHSGYCGSFGQAWAMAEECAQQDIESEEPFSV